MNNGLRLVNIGDGGVGLRDTRGRIYNVPRGGQIRVTEEGLQGILDDPINKKMICSGLIRIDGATEEMLANCILEDEELNYILGDRIAPTEDTSITKEVVAVYSDEVEAEAEEVKAIVFYNWINNDKKDKLEQSLTNPKNVQTLKEIVSKSDKYNTDLVKSLLSDK